MRSVFNFILWFSLSQVSVANVLPRGDSLGPGRKYLVSKGEGDCHTYHLNPYHSKIVYDEKNDFFYFVAYDSEKNGKPFFNLYEGSLSRLKVKTLARVSFEASGALMVHGHPVRATTLIQRWNQEQGCGQGSSRGISIRWGGNRKLVQSFSKLTYKLLPSNLGSLLYDIKEQALFDFDFISMKPKKIASLQTEHMPLFVDFANKSLIAHTKTGLGAILKYDMSTKKLVSRLNLGSGMKVIQQGGLIAIAKYQVSEQKIVVHRIKGWSGDYSESWSYPATSLTFDEARVEIDFHTGLAFISSNALNVPAERTHIDVIDGVKSRTLITVKAQSKAFFDSSALSPNSRHFVALELSKRDLSFKGVTIYSLQNRKLHRIKR